MSTRGACSSRSCSETSNGRARLEIDPPESVLIDRQFRAEVVRDNVVPVFGLDPAKAQVVQRQRMCAVRVHGLDRPVEAAFVPIRAHDPAAESPLATIVEHDRPAPLLCGSHSRRTALR